MNARCGGNLKSGLPAKSARTAAVNAASAYSCADIEPPPEADLRHCAASLTRSNVIPAAEMLDLTPNTPSEVSTVRPVRRKIGWPLVAAVPVALGGQLARPSRVDFLSLIAAGSTVACAFIGKTV